MPRPNEALRISAGSDRRQQVPVGLAGVEQSADPVVPERREAEGGPLHPLDQVVDRLRGPVGDVGDVPGGDLLPPADQRAAEGAGLDRVVGVLEVVTELGHPLEGELGIGVLVELPDGFLGFPAGGHITVRIAGPEQACQLLVTLLVEALLGLGQQAPTAVEGIGLPAPVTEGLVLDPATALVDLVLASFVRWNRTFTTRVVSGTSNTRR